MKTVGFQTELCKPQHPFTKRKGERHSFCKRELPCRKNLLEYYGPKPAALNWCDQQNSIYHKATAGVPQERYYSRCAERILMLEMNPALLFYLYPERKISFDGFVNYEDRRFGVPFSYHGTTACVMRKDDMICICSVDLKRQLTTHDVTWSKRDRFCKDQYATLGQLEEFPIMPVKAEIVRRPKPEPSLPFEKLNFDKEVIWDE